MLAMSCLFSFRMLPTCQWICRLYSTTATPSEAQRRVLLDKRSLSMSVIPYLTPRQLNWPTYSAVAPARAHAWGARRSWAFHGGRHRARAASSASRMAPHRVVVATLVGAAAWTLAMQDGSRARLEGVALGNWEDSVGAVGCLRGMAV